MKAEGRQQGKEAGSACGLTVAAAAAAESSDLKPLIIPGRLRMGYG